MSKKEIIEQIVAEAVSEETTKAKLSEMADRVAFVKDMLPDD